MYYPAGPLPPCITLSGSNSCYVYIDVYSKDGQQVYFFKGSLPGTIEAYDEYCARYRNQTDSSEK